MPYQAETSLPSAPPTEGAYFDFSQAPVGWSFIVQGTAGDDFVIGSSGNDSISGGLGSDVLIGGPGSDTLAGGAGDDLLIGGPGSDSLSGGAGEDQIIFGVGDVVRGGPGADHFIFHFDPGGTRGFATVLDFHPSEGDTFWYDNLGFDDSVYSMPFSEVVYGAESGNAVAIIGVGSAFWSDLKG